MRICPTFLSLPTSLLFLATEAHAFANHGTQDKAPIGILKMSDDPNEKFYMHYWQYEDSLQTPAQRPIHPLRSRDLKEELLLSANSSAAIAYRPAFALHADKSRREREVIAVLQRRGFACPVGTATCGDFAPNSCCPEGEACYSITDTGLGSIGCCPEGTTCAGSVDGCMAPNTPCANDGTTEGYDYGGCCIENYICAGVGCVYNPSLLVTLVVSQTITVGTSVSSVRPVTGYACAPSSSCSPSSDVTPSITFTSTPNGILPIRPTDASPSTSSAFIFPTTTALAGSGSGSGTCPTGFYACSAYYAGGCCRVGRDCKDIDCPASSETTIISAGVTIVVPVGSAAKVATPTGACASGWSTCAASVGGNCCPTGYECGTASCSSVGASATDLVQKGSPAKSGGERVSMGWVRVMLVAMMMLSIW
ncbi:hypothetical protein BJ878DRAFT_465348 [Calycina marina]|uniref:GPI anchored protein n=1 Tax=Calycina marina TaxID=1763456 RepID=A0A9P7YZ60_9HELO|nr:hypothetical protein BJ878DRAFT_465348 [Calycina marina]